MLENTLYLPELVVESMHDLDDGALLEKVSREDKNAFEVLYKRFHRRVYQFVFRQLHSHELAEEATADTLYAVWKQAGSFQGRSAVSTWILGIAYRSSLKILEKNARHTRSRDPESELDTTEDANPSHNPEHLTEQRLVSEQVQYAMEHLSPDHIAVVQLTAVGHSCEEIAAVVGCPKNTVKTRMFHARRQLRAALGALYSPSTQRE